MHFRHCQAATLTRRDVSRLQFLLSSGPVSNQQACRGSYNVQLKGQRRDPNKGTNKVLQRGQASASLVEAGASRQLPAWQQPGQHHTLS